MRRDNGGERLPIVDPDGRVVGEASRAECHGGSMLLHPVVHLHVIDSLGRLYLQRRPEWKDIQPGRWDTAVGGHIDAGEDRESALQREAREELGIESFEAEFVCSYVFCSPRERELVNVYCCCYDGAIAPSDELDGGRFWTRREIEEQLGRGIFTPNFEGEAARIGLLDRLK